MMAVVLTLAWVSRSQAGVAIAAGPGGILMDAVRTGAVFSLLQGAFYQASTAAPQDATVYSATS